MIVAIHQPNFFPWLGFFAKLSQADVFVFLDDAAISRTGGTWSNRVKLLANGRPTWATAPIDRTGSQSLALKDIAYDASQPWRRKLCRMIELAYGRAPLFRDVSEFLNPLLLNEQNNLVEYNLSAIRRLASVLGISIQDSLRSSELGIRTQGTQRLVDIATRLGARTYLCGDGATGYQDDSLFQEHGIAVRRQQFLAKPYAQFSSSDFVPGLSVVDALMNVGPKQVASLLAPGLSLDGPCRVGAMS